MGKRLLAALSVLATAACGGKIADDTAANPGPTTDASVAPESSSPPPVVVDASPPPPSQDCTSTVVDIGSGGDVCAASEKWSCGSDDFEFRCSCPQATCECWQNGFQKKLVGEIVQCPGCIEIQDAISICGFPH